jgi:hypothetical protein
MGTHHERQVVLLALVHDRLHRQQDAQEDARDDRADQPDGAGVVPPQVQEADREGAGCGDQDQQRAAQVPILENQAGDDWAIHT